MFIGFGLGIALAVFIVSGVFLFSSIFNGLEQSAFTGAVIGTEGIVSYSIIAFIFSFIAIILLFLLLKNKPVGYN